MDEPSDIPQQEEPSSQKSRRKISELLGQNILGITYIAPDFYEDLPLEFLLGEDEPISESDTGEPDQRTSKSSTSME